MNKEFVPYPEALALKELGFDEPTSFYWEHKNIRPLPMKDEVCAFHFNRHTHTENEWICAPLYQQAFRWFRKNHGLHGIYTMGDDWNNFYWQVWKNDCMTKTYVCSSDYVFEIYEEAELACLKKLIEIVKQKQ